MADLNKVLLLGRMTRDVEMRYMPSGSPVSNFGMAINRYYSQGNEKKQDTTFVDIECFGKTAELASQYLSKGRQVLIEGRLRFRSWEGQDGKKRNKLSVVAERVTFLGGKDDNSNDSYYNDKPDKPKDEAPKWNPENDGDIDGTDYDDSAPF